MTLESTPEPVSPLVPVTATAPRTKFGAPLTATLTVAVGGSVSIVTWTPGPAGPRRTGSFWT